MFFHTKLEKLPRANRDWSELQQRIFSDIEQSNTNITIEAKPGSGKSTTMTESIYRLPEAQQKTALFMAFGKRDQLHLDRLVPEKTTCKTAHSIGYGMLKAAFGKITLDHSTMDHIGKDDRIALQLADNSADLAEDLAKAISLCKAHLANSREEIEEVIGQYDLHSNDISFINKIEEGLYLHEKEYNTVGFDDMIWLPHRLGIPSVNRYSHVYLDEGQDMTIAQLDLISKLIKKDGKLIACLDSNQICFSFRGSIKSTDIVKDGFNCDTLHLSVSYRCAKKIVKMAQELVPSIQPADKSPEGIIEEGSYDQMVEQAKSGDMILSRYNYPLIKYCLKMLKKGKPANIQGRNLSWSFLWMIKQSGMNTLAGFSSWLEDWLDEQVSIREEMKRGHEYIDDKYQCMQNFMEDCTTLDEVKNNISSAFKNVDYPEKMINFSSIHRSKGREAERVWLLDKTCKPNKNQEEKNLFYIGITRAQHTLMLVH